VASLVAKFEIRSDCPACTITREAIADYGLGATCGGKRLTEVTARIRRPLRKVPQLLEDHRPKSDGEKLLDKIGERSKARLENCKTTPQLKIRPVE